MKKVLKVSATEYGEGAVILYSARQKDVTETQGDFRVRSNFSFAYVAGDCAAEWEPQYGPIQLWDKCNVDDIEAKKHYIFEYTNSGGLNWSQISVDRHELPQAAARGDWQYIFNVLKDWSENK